MSNRQPPLYCPYCAEQDLFPSDVGSAAWECRSCARVFSLKMLGLANSPTTNGAMS